MPLHHPGVTPAKIIGRLTSVFAEISLARLRYIPWIQSQEVADLPHDIDLSVFQYAIRVRQSSHDLQQHHLLTGRVMLSYETGELP